MKAITIDFYGKEADYILLEDVDDVLEYAVDLADSTETAATRMIKSNLPPERFDHLASNDKIGGQIAAAAQLTFIRGGSAIAELGIMAHDKIQRFMNYVLKGEQIMLNKNGGFCFLTENTKILREAPYAFTKESTHTIRENTTYINLENDADLEQHTIDHLSKIDPNYSYITSLRNYEVSDLIDVFKEFKTNGGSVAYLYTTGFDLQQIHDYCSALRTAGIKKIEFEFNAGISEDLQETLDDISKQMTVTLLGEK